MNNQNIVLVRHAQSTFNQGRKIYCQKMNISLDIDWQTLIQNENFRKQVPFQMEFIDCRITSFGKQQCLKAKNKLKDYDVDLVIVSPQIRTLQTCQIIFGDRKIPFIVHPLLTEVFRYACDIGTSIEMKKKQFTKYDFSEMQHYKEDYYLQVLSLKNQQRCYKQFKEQKSMNQSQKHQILLTLLKNKQVQRVKLAKQLIQKYTHQYKKIAIISHHYTIQYLIAQDFEQDSSLKLKKQIQNATPILTNINKLMMIE